MKIAFPLTAVLFLGACYGGAHSREEQDDALCTALDAFLASVAPEETREVTLRTYWGAKDVRSEFIMGSKACEFGDYEPGERLCTAIIENSSTEFAGYNAKRILNCLIPKPGIAADLEIHSGSFSTAFGSPDGGAWVDLELAPGDDSGEMTLLLKADGY